MGVRRLQTVLERFCPGGCYEVKIQDIADDFRRTEKREPVIVVDGTCSFRTLYGDLDWVCGGQYKEYVDHINEFLKKFSDLGITLVIFFDGATQESKRPVWVDRRLAGMEKAHTIIDKIKAGCKVGQIDKELFVIPPGAGHVMSSICRSKCKVQRSIKECDEEIALYADNNKCLAILAQDTDFVIYQNKAKFYLSSENLDLERMTTLVYDRNALTRYLNISLCDLPVLASLMGNDFISADDLKPFHSRLTGRVSRQPYTEVLVQKIAMYIHRLPKGQDLFLNLRQLSMEVFGTPNRAEDFRKSILSYSAVLKHNSISEKFENNFENWKKVMCIAHLNYVEMKFPPYIFNILRKLPFEMSTALEDHRTSTPPSAVALRPLRQRMYGILLHEFPSKSSEDLVVDEWCMTGDLSLKRALKVSAVLPPESSPYLLDLWEGESDESLTAAKFKLLAWISSPQHLSNTNLRALPHQIILAICILSYLYHDAGLVRDWEVKAVAAMIVDLQAMDASELSQVQVKQIKVRGVQLAALFTRAITHLALANAICGKPIEDQWTAHQHNFDGKLFQSVFMTAEKNPPTPKRGSSQHYQQICDLVLKGVASY